MNFVIDLIVISIILLFVFMSAKKGFVNAVVSTVGFVAAIVLAFTISTPLSNATYDKVIEPAIINSVSKEANTEIDNAINTSWESLPAIVKNNAGLLGISQETFNQSISGNITNGVENAIITASQNIIRPTAVKVIGMIYSVILTVVLLIIVQVLAKFINKLFSFSIVGKLNRTLGGVVGIIKGSAVAVVFCMAVSMIIPLTNGGFWIFTPENIEATFIFKTLANLIPFNIF